uniref:TRAF4-associated factor 1-like protein n=2 Tax=Callorhinchus milii TaxID=7868 RepID=A0A4W3JF98_CALMI
MLYECISVDMPPHISPCCICIALYLAGEMQKSRLPTKQPRDASAAVPPQEAKIPRQESRTLGSLTNKNHPANPVVPEFNKDLPQTFNFSQKPFEASSTQQSLVQNKRLKMYAGSRMTRANMEHYRALKVAEAELRDQVQLLEVAQHQLQQSLMEKEDEREKLLSKAEDLECQKEVLSKKLQFCMVVLESNLIDPISANKVVENLEQKDKCRRETMVHVENLQEELKMLKMAEKREKLQELRRMWQTVKEESEEMMQDSDLFQKELDEWRQLVEESKQLVEVEQSELN